MPDESEQAKAWSQIPLKALYTCSTDWKLNERMYVILLSIDMSHFHHISVVYISYVFSIFFMYGELLGLNKKRKKTVDKYGKEQVHKWRRSCDIYPPNGESFGMCAEIVVACLKEQVSVTYFIRLAIFYLSS